MKLIVVLLAILIAAAIFFNKTALEPIKPISQIKPGSIINKQVTYDSLLKQISNLKKIFKEKNEGQYEIKAGKLFDSIIVNLLAPEWVGTDWDFNGICTQPQKGSIACGYFVATLLQHAGVQINRVKCGQADSYDAMKQLGVTDKKIYLGDRSHEAFLKGISQLAEGLYITGLDNHIGLIYRNISGDLFIHSSVLSPGTVVMEPLNTSEALILSNYKMLCPLSTHKGFISRWVKN
jgi:hypothetical protein